MNIEYLKTLEEIPFPLDAPRLVNKGLSIDEIELLEQEFNNGQVFPKALREFLFLAGTYCYCSHYSPVNNPQRRMQLELRRELLKYNQTLPNPVYVVSNFEDNTFGCIFLNEGDDPILYNIIPSPGYDEVFISNRNVTLSNFFNYSAYKSSIGERFLP